MSRATASPPELETLLQLHDAAFGRTDRESRLVGALALGHPAYREDLHVSLLDEDSDEPVAAALVLPRRIELRGSELLVGVLAPWAVSPAYRERGNGKRIVELAAERARELGLLALITIGDPDFLGALGFGSAFDLYTVHATTERLPADDAADEWRGLVGEDLPRLAALYAAARTGVSGTELRDACVPDWEAHAADSYALVHAPAGRVEAYVRFRVREELEISECAAADANGVEACLRLFARLAREHGRLSLLVHAAPTQPVALALAARGCVQERSRFDGAAQLRVLDWPAVFNATANWWRPLLGESALGLRIDGRCLQLDNSAARWVDTPPPDSVTIPAGWAPGLLTGQRTAREWHYAAGASFDASPAAERLLDALFDGSPAQWSYAPVYELADE
jgi:predicted N-acetyltransferase YhbS